MLGALIGAVIGVPVGLWIVKEWPGGVWTGAGGALIGWSVCSRVLGWRGLLNIALVVGSIWLLVFLGKSGALRW
jgi:hypothetical protein